MADAAGPEIPSGINDKPDPSLFSSGGGGKRKSGKERRGLEETGGLSITSLMDALTILLVFLLKNFSSNPIEVKENADIKVPASVSDVMPTDSTAITITKRHILVDDNPVVTLDEGKVPETGLSQGGMMIDPLYERLQESVATQKRIAISNKKAEFKGLCTVIADREAPFTLLRQVTYTAGAAEFSKFKFAVIKYKS